MADEGWPAEPAELQRQESPFCLGSTGTNCRRTDVESSLCGTITQTLLGVSFTSSLQQAPHTAQLKSQKVRKRVETCHKGWPGTGRREQNGATGPTAPAGWVRSRVGVISRQTRVCRHTEPDAQCKGQGRHPAPRQHRLWDWPLKLPYTLPHLKC